ncbi:Fic family protein [Phytomonospora sp. NPDC050363]|uniref:Fic family protein n=1 Tax=Phytomonospora sp. NPDC050363 TaxID=3155642 RepID=UPI0033C2EF61
MFENQFAPDQRHNLITVGQGATAFMPPPLPPEIVFDRTLVGLSAAAERAVGELAGLGRMLPNPEIMTAPITRREAVQSSRIEGTRASESELALFELDAIVDPRDDIREVLNYVKALELVTAPDRRLPLSVPLLREAHKALMTGVRGGYAHPGDVRESQNWIGGRTIEHASFVPPPVDRLWQCLDAFEKYLHADDDLPPLIRIGCLHYQFEAIHPFADGNGRVGRLLIVMLLLEWGLLPAPLLDISAWIEPRRDAYYEGLLRVSTHGDWTGWLTFFLSGMAEQAKDAARRARNLQELQGRYLSQVMVARASAMLPSLVNALFVTPAVTINHVRDLLGVSHRTALLTVEKLVAQGILTELGNKGRTRLFGAVEIITVANS